MQLFLENDLIEVKRGQIFVTKKGERFAFQKELSAVNFIGKSLLDGKSYRVRRSTVVEFLEEFDQEETIESADPKTFKKGDLFAISEENKDHSDVFLFKGIKNGKIIGLSVGTNRTTKIDSSFIFREIDLEKIKNELK